MCESRPLISEKFHKNVRSPHYIRPKGDALSFEIRHFAGKVQYSCSEFLPKNRNFLPPEVIQVFRQSTLEVSARERCGWNSEPHFQLRMSSGGNDFTIFLLRSLRGIVGNIFLLAYLVVNH